MSRETQLDFWPNFEACVKRSQTKYGYTIECVNGNWFVAGPDKATVEKLALGHYLQYLEDYPSSNH